MIECLPKISTLDQLKRLPPGTVLRHPKSLQLVEIAEAPVGNDTVVKFGGVMQAWGLIDPKWDLPMTLLYRPGLLAAAFDKGSSQPGTANPFRPREG